SLPAIRAYLRGAEFDRLSQWDSAASYYRRAIAEDSTFALALYGLAHALGWTRTHGDPAVIALSSAALRYSHRLPERERRFLGANQLFEVGDVAALDSMRVYTERYPDDLIGWYELA